ncbi:MAG TPA: Ldh family oxidoreductase [Chloroflexota bacterium]|nr:Ldh family oxidoreductase [Chloroflexota bacterium]
MEVVIDALSRYCVEAFVRMGAPADQARTMASVLLEADLRGHVDHGASLVALFRADVQTRAVNICPRVQVLHETPISLLVDGDGGFGAVAASHAMSACIDRARATGIGVAAVRHSSHVFYPGYYPLQAAEAGLIGFFTTTSRPAIAPTGAAERVLGQNPIAYAIPAGAHPPILLDVGMAASVAKIRIAMDQGQRVPEGWALDRDGNPTTDAAEAMAGLLVPIGGHKGYGLALVMDALVGLGGAPTGRLAGPHGAVGHFLWALDPGLFGSPDDFRARVDRLLDDLTGAERLPGRSAVAYPGEAGARRKAAALAVGRIELPAAIVQAMEDTAHALSIRSPGQV